MVFTSRLRAQLDQLKSIPHSANSEALQETLMLMLPLTPMKIGIIGHHFVSAYLNLSRSYLTTQIEHYDNLAAQLDALKRINTIFIDFCRDVWNYVIWIISSKNKKGEVAHCNAPQGESIDFENAEGNLGPTRCLNTCHPNCLFQDSKRFNRFYRTEKCVPFGHLMIALTSMNKGLEKPLVNETKIAEI